MARNRRGLAPWSLAREAGIESATVDGTIEVPQYVQPVLDTGFVDEKGDWKGVKSSDRDFSYFSKDEAIANGGSIDAPADIGTLSMVGFNDIQIAIRVSNGGNFAIEAVMGSDGSASLPYYNLHPVDAGTLLLGNLYSKQEFQNLFRDTAQSLTADVWNIFYLEQALRNQARLGFKITNNSGDVSDIETAFLRLV